MRARLLKDVEIYPGLTLSRSSIVCIDCTEEGKVYMIGYRYRILKEDEYKPHMSGFDYDRLLKSR